MNPKDTRGWVGTHNGTLRKPDGTPKFDHVDRGNPDPKILRKLAARRKADAAHGTHKGKHLHTVPGSMKKGGGY